MKENIKKKRLHKKIIGKIILIFFLKIGIIANAQQGGFTIIALDLKNQITYDDIWNLNILDVPQ